VWRKAIRVSYADRHQLAALTQRLLLQEQEARVDELKELGEVVEVVEDNQLVGPTTLVVTNGEEKTLPGNRGDQLFREQGEEGAADGREVKVVHLEQKVELKRLSAAHKLAPAEDCDVVYDERNDANFERGERRLSLYEAEVLGLVASNGLEALLKDRP
jgi:hypothetical protein